VNLISSLPLSVWFPRNRRKFFSINFFFWILIVKSRFQVQMRTRIEWFQNLNFLSIFLCFLNQTESARSWNFENQMQLSERESCIWYIYIYIYIYIYRLYSFFCWINFSDFSGNKQADLFIYFILKFKLFDNLCNGILQEIKWCRI